MREITFNWAGEELTFQPSMALLSRIAGDLRKATDGAETTVSMAYKCVNGGAEPMFLLLALRAVMLSIKGPNACPTDEALLEHAMNNITDMVAFRIAYVEAILPQVDLGKGRAALPAAGAGTKAAKTGNKKKSISKPST